MTFRIELVTIKWETMCLSEDTLELKETTNKFSSKLIWNELDTLNSETPSIESTTVTTTPHEDNISNIPPYFEERVEHMSVNIIIEA